MAGFDPSQFGATPVAAPAAPTAAPGGFDASQFGATPVQASVTPPPTPAPATPGPAPAEQAVDPVQAPSDGGVALDKLSSAVSSIFPGGQIGKTVGTYGGYAVAALTDLLNHVQGHPTTLAKNYDLSTPTPLQDAGDAANAALSVALPEDGEAAAPLARIGAQAAAGAGIGAASDLANNPNPTVGDVIQHAVTTGALGAGLGTAGEAAGSILDNLPKWFAQKALPKLDAANVPYALQNTKVGPISSLLDSSTQAVKSYAGQINSILSHPQYATSVGNGAQPIDAAANAFPNSGLTPDNVVDIVKQVVPQQKDLIDKVVNGTATLMEKNQLRQTADQAVKKVFTDNPQVSFSKQVTAAFSNALRNDVQTNAPETKPIFANFTKELNLNTALKGAQKKIEKGTAVGLYDIISGLGGFVGSGGNPLAAAGAVAVEKALRSPTAQLAAAKGVRAIAPALKLAGGAAEAPLMKTVGAN